MFSFFIGLGTFLIITFISDRGKASPIFIITTLALIYGFYKLLKIFFTISLLSRFLLTLFFGIGLIFLMSYLHDKYINTYSAEEIKKTLIRYPLFIGLITLLSFIAKTYYFGEDNITGTFALIKWSFQALYLFFIGYLSFWFLLVWVMVLRSFFSVKVRQ